MVLVHQVFAAFSEAMPIGKDETREVSEAYNIDWYDVGGRGTYVLSIRHLLISPTAHI